MKAIRLAPPDAERYTRLRLEMLTAAPWAFGATPNDDKGLDVSHLTEMLAKDHYAIFGIEDANKELVAAAGILRAVREKKAHRAIVWGAYVNADHRGKGYGRAVVGAAIDLAKSWRGIDFIDLSVSENSPEAKSLYQSLGFERWGREPETMDVEGRRFDEIYMTLRL